MPNQNRIDPNYPGLDPALAFRPDADIRMETKQVSGAAYSIIPADYYRRLSVSAAAAMVVTIPAMALTDFPVGGLLTVQRFGSGPVSIVGANGVTVEKAVGFATPVAIDSDQGSVCLMRKDVSTWTAFGALVKA